MSKNKQQENENLNENIENKDEETNNIQKNSSSTSSNIIYQGSVKVTVKKGNKIISSKNYHNAGGIPLFNFLNSCIAGKYQEKDRPKNIMLFYNDVTYSQSNNTINSSSTPCSSFIALNRVGISDDRKGVVLHFTIPCAFVTAKNDGKVNQIGLYSAANSLETSKEDFSACWNFLNSAGSEWEP